MKILSLAMFILVFATSISLSKTQIVGDSDCTITDANTLQAFYQIDFDELVEEITPNVSRIVFQCIDVHELLTISINRPGLSIIFRDVVFQGGYTLRRSTLRSFVNESNIFSFGTIRIIENSMQNLEIEKLHLEASILLSRNNLTGNLIIGDEKYVAGFEEDKILITDELAILLNQVGGIISLGSINVPMSKNMPFIFGNSMGSLFIWMSKFNCDECFDAFTVTRNDIRDAIDIDGVVTNTQIEISGDHLNSLEITNSTIKRLLILGQSIRDVFIHDRKKQSSTNIETIQFDDSAFSYLKFFNITSKDVDCSGCIIEDTASFSGFFERVSLYGASIKGSIDFGLIELNNEWLGGKLIQLELKNTISPLIIFDKVLDEKDTKIDWDLNQIEKIGFAKAVENPEGLAKKVSDSSNIEPLLRLLADYFERSEKRNFANELWYKIHSNRILHSDESFVWKYSKWTFGAIVGFGYYYMNLVIVSSALILIGAILFARNNQKKIRNSLFDGVFYSLDNLVPGLNLDERYQFTFQPIIPRIFFYLMRLFGFIAVAAILADLGNVFAF